ncbi:MAG: ABC transporter substrate-binding protein [Puniceicoccales bacterium]|jgi:polar amino acid transport system substrate-binding protein|nr:ABC transporter substrate-binding protein [Puniceicoccales bacterium]
MKKFTSTVIALGLSLLTFGCGPVRNPDELHIAVSVDYPPFEYVADGKFVGFDIDLANAIGAALEKKVIFHDMSFNSILFALKSGDVDAAISTITATEERRKQFDFSVPYFREEICMVVHRLRSRNNAGDFSGLRVACQLGTTMEIWLKKHGGGGEIIAMDNSNQAIEALKSANVDAVVIDGFQAREFCKKNGYLQFYSLAQSEDGYALAFCRGSNLTIAVDEILLSMEEDGALEQLKEKWGIGGTR